MMPIPTAEEIEKFSRYLREDRGGEALLFLKKYEDYIREEKFLDRNNGSALYYAIINNDSLFIERLINAGADINQRDAGGWTPLMLALSNFRYAPVQVLLEHGADVTARSNDGKDDAFSLLETWVWPEEPDGVTRLCYAQIKNEMNAARNRNEMKSGIDKPVQAVKLKLKAPQVKL